MIHHYTIRTYTAALMDLFNDLEVSYTLSDGTIKTKNIPIKYTTKEKSITLDEYTTEQLLSGNTNVLPCSSLAFVGLNTLNERQTNKNARINRVKDKDEYSYSYNSVSYGFEYSLIIKCRGMNELTSIIEQIAPKFNPSVNIDVADAQNLNLMSRVPVILNSIDFEDDNYNETSSNIFTITVNLIIKGSLYPPIREITKIKKYKIFLNQENDDGTYTRKSVQNWDIDNSGNMINGEIDIIDNVRLFPPEIQGLVTSKPFTIGKNEITGIYEDKDGKIDEEKFEFTILRGEEYILEYTVVNDKITIIMKDNTPPRYEVELMFKVTDIYNNFDTLSKVFRTHHTIHHKIHSPND